jgi:hypothetical protein
MTQSDVFGLGALGLGGLEDTGVICSVGGGAGKVEVEVEVPAEVEDRGRVLGRMSLAEV